MKTLLQEELDLRSRSRISGWRGRPSPAYKAGVADEGHHARRVHVDGRLVTARADKPAEGKVHDLYATALCLEDATGKRLVLVTTDLIGIPRTLGDEVAAEVEKKHGLKRDQLILSASHTHCGPVIRENLIDILPADEGGGCEG